MKCPFCGSLDLRTVLDNGGALCWCNDCSRTWIPTEEDEEREAADDDPVEQKQP